jgi:hypothetical protein
MVRTSTLLSLCLASAFCLALLAPPPVWAANYNKTYAVVSNAYDIGAYESAIDHILQDADGRGVFGGPGSTAAKRAQDRDLTRRSLLSQRDTVLRMTSDKVAAAATDKQIEELIRMAGPESGTVDQSHVKVTVALIKAQFNDAAWFQMVRSARGNAEFLCQKGDKTYCP